MTMKIEKIEPSQLDAVLYVAEGHFSEVKSIEIRPGRLTEAIAAFANADGGELYIGIDETGDQKHRGWRGFDDVEAANGHIQIFEQLFPLGRDFSYSFLSCEGETGIVLKIDIMKTMAIMHASDGQPYIRRGAQSIRVVTPEQIRRLEYVKGLTSFESEPISIDLDLVCNSTEVIEFMLEVVPTSEPEAWLRKQQMVNDGRPTVGAVLIFAEEPQAILPKRCGLKIYRYRTKDLQGSRDTLAFDPLTIEGPMYKQIYAAVAETSRIIEDIKKLGDRTLEDITYPPETLHEIITNAVLHRDYSIADDIHIRVFDNRVEVESPGRLPAHITVDNILDERFARNGTIVRLLNKYPTPPNKDVGEGLNTAFAAMTKLGLKEPIIENRDNSVVVKIRHESLASPETIILSFLEENDSIQNKQARELCHIPGDYVVKEIFKRLVERELIEKVPGTRTASTAYRRGKLFDTWRGTARESETEGS
ncbi:MAG: ATP-binding protein [Propionibacteriaceae bacterium]